MHCQEHFLLSKSRCSQSSGTYTRRRRAGSRWSSVGSTGYPYAG
uniref:Uncharacterized protein n=1 Tax=Arundo donax TaxID=35708 RepID=A0A0A9G1S5_ARUDO